MLEIANLITVIAKPVKSVPWNPFRVHIKYHFLRLKRGSTNRELTVYSIIFCISSKVSVCQYQIS